MALLCGKVKIKHELQTLISSFGELISFRDHRNPQMKSCDLVLLHYDSVNLISMEVLREIKLKFPKLSIILFGKFFDAARVIQASRLGVSDFLTYPFREEEFEKVMTNVLKVKPPVFERIKNTTRRQAKFLIESTMEYSRAMNVSSIVHPAFSFNETIENEHDLVVRMFGEFTIFDSKNNAIKLPGRKAKSLLAYLFNKYPKPVHRDNLINQFWEYSSSDSARNCLNVNINTIRKCFEKAGFDKKLIVFSEELYRINPDLLVEKDVTRYKLLLYEGARMEELNDKESAAKLYREADLLFTRDFLEDLPFEDWAASSRRNFNLNSIIVQNKLSKYFFEKKNYHLCAAICRRMLDKDNCLEETHLRIMKCFMELGTRDMAIRQFKACEEALETMELKPGKSIRAFYEAVRTA